jgi:anti-anti-sigma factor
VNSELFGIGAYERDGCRVVVPSGELDAASRAAMDEQLVGPAGSLIVVDLGRLTFIDSSGLGAIATAKRKALANDGDLVLCRPSPAVQRVLEITGLDLWIAEWDPAWSDGC